MNTDEPENTSRQESQTPPPPPIHARPRRANRTGLWIAATTGCLLILLLSILVPILLIAGLIGALSGSPAPRGDRLAVIRVEGVITGGSEGGLFSGASAGSERIVSQLEKARRDGHIRAIVIRIDSPGGSAAGSEEVYKEILRVRQDKPVYASMGDVAASGGYYIASACDHIYANGATITGSIGVIMETSDLSGLFKKIGVAPQVVKSGKYKDIGSPARPMTADERQLIQGMINDTFDQFITAVSDGRHLPKARVRELATGQVWTGRQARQIGLVDRLGGMRDAVLAAAHDNGLTGEPRVEDYGRRGGLAGLLGSDAESSYRNREYDLLLDRLIKRLSSDGGTLEGLH